MNIKDIVNRDIVNLDNCEQEPIHIPGSIQPHGFLLGIRRDNWLIDFCSGNTEHYVAKTYTTLLGKGFSAIFGEGNQAALSSFIDKKTFLSSTPLTLEIDGNGFTCTVHESGDVYVLEAEPFSEEQALPDTYEQARQFLSYMEHTDSLQGLCDAVARGIREITGYDRVMIYRFDEEYNGEIFAECKRDDLEPFFGLHYPHTDIPVQARELYIRNLLRIITDINYTPVPIYTIDNAVGKNLDLSLSKLRSTSPIHVQYLSNMGVGATLTISLLHKGQLWGLIACHHYSAKNISYPVRIATQLNGHFITSQIDVRQSNEEYYVSRKSNEALERLSAIHLDNTRNSFASLLTDNTILDICNATGVCILMGDNIFTKGKTPDENIIRDIVRELSALSKNTGIASRQLSAEIPRAASHCDTAAGVVYHSLSVSGNDCIIWFRGETISEVTWAGDPNKAIVKDENGLHPRKSFSQWKEIVKCTSSPWLTPELNAAANFAHLLEKQVTMLILSEEEERYRKLSEVLKQSNEELENVNWISTHDLQEPLRKIQLMSSRILANENPEQAARNTDLVKRMNASANKMQNLLHDLLNYVKIKNSEKLMEPLSLNDIVESAREELQDTIDETQAQITIGELPEINGIPFLLRQLFVNLIANSLKFTAPGKPQLITISGQRVSAGEVPGNDVEGDHYCISVADTGIGFEEKFAESIFKIFTRLHTTRDYEGSGIGLALCKKIMQTHNGFITASGKPGEGARVDLYFPTK